MMIDAVMYGYTPSDGDAELTQRAAAEHVQRAQEGARAVVALERLVAAAPG